MREDGIDRPRGGAHMAIPNAAWSTGGTGWANKIRRALGPRRWRLFLSACCRGLFKDPVPADVLQAFDVTDRFADTGQTKSALAKAKRLGYENPSADPPEFTLNNSHMQFLGDSGELLQELFNLDLPNELLPRMGISAQWDRRMKFAASRAYLQRILTEFDPPAGVAKRFDPRWRTADVVDLARGIYRAYAFDRLPVLADALMDAGCADKEVLGHCRSKGPHVRGCWVLDLILEGQWETVWSDAKPAARPKIPKAPAAPAGSAFQLTPAVAREIDELMKDEAKWPAAAAIARAYAERKKYRKEAVKNSMGYLGYTAEQAEASVAFDCLHYAPERLRCGIARRVRLDDPRELAQYVSLEARAEWIKLSGDSNGEPLERTQPVLLAAAVGDNLVLRRFVETSPFPLTAGQPDEVCHYNAVYALAANDLTALRRQFPYRPRRKADGYPVPHLACLGAVAQHDPDRFATGLAAMLEATKRSFKGAITGLIDVYTHGVYELCRRAGSGGAGAFDVNYPPPWDAALARWVRGRDDALADLDWKTIPEEIRPGLRDLTRPIWADAPAPGGAEDDEE